MHRAVASWLALFMFLLPCVAGADEWLIAGPLRGGSRAMLGPDPLLERMLRNGEPPKDGEAIGDTTWRAVKPGPDGAVHDEGLYPGVAWVTFESDRDTVVLLNVAGVGTAWLNGVPCVGDVYMHGVTWAPVQVRRGTNTLAARCGRGVFSWLMRPVPAPVCFNEHDLTLPSCVEGRPASPWGAVPVVNATSAWVRDAVLEDAAGTHVLPPLAPLSLQKVPFRLHEGRATEVRVTHAGTTHRVAPSLGRNRAGSESRTVTFVSGLDDSVQTYAWAPPPGFDPSRPYPLLVTLHGAGVGCNGHIDAFAAHPWCLKLAPQNRRHYGFDWEDWGRLDALEALTDLRSKLQVDASRIYLSGHSMGGHGTWQLAVHSPDLWAAASPSAGWLSHYTYPPFARRDPAVEFADPFRRSSAPSDTVGLFRNLETLPVFAIHGTADDNVPVDQAEAARDLLKEFHHDWEIVLVDGKGHWWDGPDPGVDCVSMTRLFDWFQRHRRADLPGRYTFRTYSPGVSSRCREVEVVAQQDPYALSTVSLEWTAVLENETVWHNRCLVTTANVDHLVVGARGSELILDGAAQAKDGEFHRAAGGWVPGPPPGLRKTPARQGPIAQAFQRPFVFVLPTAGDPAEYEDALRFARLQGQQYWYRGNGRARILDDVEVTDAHRQDLNLVLLGSSKSNTCWASLADRLPFSAAPGEIRAVDEVLKGDFAIAAVYPLPGSPDRLVAVVGASGPESRRTWCSLQVFSSNLGTPDLAVWGPDLPVKGRDAVRLAAIFGPDWKPLPSLWKRIP